MRVGKQFQSIETIEIPDILDHRPVAIEEHGRAGSRAGLLEKPPDGVVHPLGRNSFHAPMIDRAVAQKTGPAEHVVRKGRRLLCASSCGVSGRCSARPSARKCRRPAHPAPPARCSAPESLATTTLQCDMTPISISRSVCPIEIDALDVAGGIAIFAAAKHDARDARSSPSRRRELGKAFRRPPLRVAERRARRDADQRLIRAPSTVPQKCHRGRARRSPRTTASCAVSGPVSMPSSSDEIRIVLGKRDASSRPRGPLSSAAGGGSRCRYPHRSFTPARFRIHADRKELGNRMPMSPLQSVTLPCHARGR